MHYVNCIPLQLHVIKMQIRCNHFDVCSGKPTHPSPVPRFLACSPQLLTPSPDMILCCRGSCLEAENGEPPGLVKGSLCKHFGTLPSSVLFPGCPTENEASEAPPLGGSLGSLPWGERSITLPFLQRWHSAGQDGSWSVGTHYEDCFKSARASQQS